MSPCFFSMRLSLLANFVAGVLGTTSSKKDNFSHENTDFEISVFACSTLRATCLCWPVSRDTLCVAMFFSLSNALWARLLLRAWKLSYSENPGEKQYFLVRWPCELQG